MSNVESRTADSWRIRDQQLAASGRWPAVSGPNSLRSVWHRLRRAHYTRRAARALGCSPSQLDVSGPCVIHGGGKFIVGKNVSIRATPRLSVELHCAPGATIILKDHSFINQGVHISCTREIVIGERALLADQVLIMDTDFHAVGDGEIQSAPVAIGAGAWLGARAIILKGVTVGDGAIIGAGAVVSRSIPPRAIAVGNPARVVRTLA